MKTFSDLSDDQFDFHTYSLRKMTLRSYTNILSMSDKVRSHPFYREAAFLALETYIHLYDKPKTSRLEEELGIICYYILTFREYEYFRKEKSFKKSQKG